MSSGQDMTYATANGVRLAYDVIGGPGEPVLLVMGSAARGRVWHAYQVPALTAAGYRVVTFDNRGMPPSDVPPGPYVLADLVGDTAGLIEALGLGPARVVGVSMGAAVTQELALARPDLVRSAVLMATKSRSDAVRRAYARGASELADRLAEHGVELPAAFSAVTQALQALSPATLNDDSLASPWLEMFEYFPVSGNGSGIVAQIGVTEFGDRREALTGVQVPCSVVAFEDDLVTPAYLGREVAEAIPGCEYVCLPHCGHLGYLERPDAVNEILLDFLART